MKTIRDVMSKPVVMIEEDRTVAEAAKLMGERRIGSLIVTRDGEPIGIVTERDVLTKAIACDLDICKVKVKDIMSSPLIVVKPDITVEDAIKVMAAKGIRRLPVEEEGEIIGIFTAADLVRLVAMAKQKLEEMKG